MTPLFQHSILIFSGAITVGLSTIEFPVAGAGRTVAGPAVEEGPDFVGPIHNVTVALGREAILVCPTTELGNFRVGWMKADDQTILTLHNKLVTHNPRIGITHDSNNWNLHIRQVKEADKGCYMCQINTGVMKKQVGCVDVHVPPDIDDAGTSSDVTVAEGENATLTCRASGHPPPRINWRREGSEQIVLRGKTPKDTAKMESYSGESLHLAKLERRQMGAYFCIASNDVPPAVSKRITLNVNFAPVVKVPNQLLGAPLGTDVQLECFVEAYPNTINYWKKNRDQFILAGPRTTVNETQNLYRVHMKLTIKAFSAGDVGTYTCVSSNSMGVAEGIVRLYEIKIATIQPSTTTETTTITVTKRTTTTTEMVLELPKTTQVPPAISWVFVSDFLTSPAPRLKAEAQTSEASLPTASVASSLTNPSPYTEAETSEACFLQQTINPLFVTPRQRILEADINENVVSGVSSRQHVTSGTCRPAAQALTLLLLVLAPAPVAR